MFVRVSYLKELRCHSNRSSALRGRPFDFWGGGGGGVIWSGREIFFQHLDSQWNFFFRVFACKLFFSPSNILQDFFFCVDGVEKVGIPLLLLATLAAVLFNSNRGSILAFLQFNSTAEQMRSVANVPNNPFVMHSYLTLSCLLHLHIYQGP